MLRGCAATDLHVHGIGCDKNQKGFCIMQITIQRLHRCELRMEAGLINMQFSLLVFDVSQCLDIISFN